MSRASASSGAEGKLVIIMLIIELRLDKTNNVRTGSTQTGLSSHKKMAGSFRFWIKKERGIVLSV